MKNKTQPVPVFSERAVFSYFTKESVKIFILLYIDNSAVFGIIKVLEYAQY